MDQPAAPTVRRNSRCTSAMTRRDALGEHTGAVDATHQFAHLDRFGAELARVLVPGVRVNLA